MYWLIADLGMPVLWHNSDCFILVALKACAILSEQVVILFDISSRPLNRIYHNSLEKSIYNCEKTKKSLEKIKKCIDKQNNMVYSIDVQKN
jgi:hypothetical protein